jgi:hypothetical protein
VPGVVELGTSRQLNSSYVPEPLALTPMPAVPTFPLRFPVIRFHCGAVPAGQTS